MLFFPGDFIALAIAFAILVAGVVSAAFIVEADALEQGRENSVEESVRAKSVTVNPGRFRLALR